MTLLEIPIKGIHELDYLPWILKQTILECKGRLDEIMLRAIPGQRSAPKFQNGKCVFEVPVDIMDFINIMSVDYRKGSFIMKASFQNRANYHIRTSVGTDMGICATIHPEVRYFIIPHI